MKKEWQTRKVGEVCRLMTGGTPSRTKPEYFGGDIRWLVSGDIHQGEIFDCPGRITEEGMTSSNAKMLPVNSVMIALNGQGKTRGTVAILRVRATCNQSLVSIFPNDPEKLMPEFLYANLHGRYQEIRQMTGDSGNDRRGLNMGLIESIQIALAPRPEQQRIVGILDETFDGIATAKANAEKNLKNARALFDSYLQSVFTQRGEGWVDRQLASLCHEITVGHVGPMKTQYKESGVPFLRSQNIRPFEVSMENAMFIDEAFHRALKNSQLRPGDLAIVRTGYPGTAAVIPPELPDSNCSDLVIVRPSKEVSPHFLAAFFNSAFGKQLVLGKIVGAAQKHFNITAAKEVMLHVPPMPEQWAIIAKSDELREETQHLEFIYQQKLAALDALKKSLLHQAFTGQL